MEEKDNEKGIRRSLNPPLIRNSPLAAVALHKSPIKLSVEFRLVRRVSPR